MRVLFKISSFLIIQEKTIQFQEKIDTMKERGHKLMDKLHDKRDEIFNKWEERSREFVSNFVDLFGREGRIVCIICLIAIVSSTF